MNNDNNNNNKGINLKRLAYASSKERKALNRGERLEVINNYIEYTSNNIKDDGKQGKVFEVVVRQLLQPHSIVLRTQSQRYNDMSIKDKTTGKMLKVELKTGGGELLNGLNWCKDWKQYITKNDIIELLKKQFNYIGYLVSFNNKNDIIDIRFMTPIQYIKWLDTYYNGWASMLTYKTNEGRLMISNPKASKKRIEFYSSVNNEGMDIIEFNDYYNINKDL